MSTQRPRFDDGHRRLAAGEIPLSYRVASFRRILAAAAASHCPYSDEKIARWAERFWWKYVRAIDLGLDEPYPEAVRDIAYDVWGQWEMTLVNMYDIARHKQLDRSQIRLPREWYADWLARLNAVGA